MSEGRKVPRLLLAAAAGGLAACATAPLKPQGLAPICTRTVANASARSAPTPEGWYALLLHQYDATKNSVPGAPLDCTGVPVAWQVTDDACRPRVDLPIPDAKLGALQPAVETLEDGRRLVWAPVLRFPNGEVLGPVALVETVEDKLTVRAMGSLRAEPERVRLGLVKLGGLTLLRTESELCKGDLAHCQRAMRLLPLRGTRFIAEPLLNFSKQCTGPAWFPIRRDEKAQLSTGWVRTFEFNTSLDFQAEQVVVHEQLTVKESDPHQDSTPARVLRKAQAERTVQLRPEGLYVDNASLWDRVEEMKSGR